MVSTGGSPPSDSGIWDAVRLTSWGWRKDCLNLDPETIDSCKNDIYACDNRHFEPIFSKHTPSGDGSRTLTPESDDKRWQTRRTIPQFYNKRKWYRTLMVNLTKVLDTILPEMEVSDCRILLSLADCKLQSFHMDIPYPTFPCFAGIISVDDSTNVVLKDMNHRVHDPGKVIDIQRGDVVIFRGDLMHAGGAYESENRRIYFKALPKGSKLCKKTQRGQVHVLQCTSHKPGLGKGCNRVFANATQLKNHKYTCPCIKTKEELEKIRKNAREASRRQREKRKAKEIGTTSTTCAHSVKKIIVNSKSIL